MSMPARRDEIEHGLGSLQPLPRIFTARPAPARGRSTAASTAVWCAAAGAVTVASFWAYLGAFELAGDASPRLLPQPDASRAQLPGCTALTLDRPSGRTTAEPCHGPAPLVRDTLAARLAEPRTR
jgi:hypothetical protein